MDKFQCMRAFREVAQQGGFAAAARVLNSSPPSVTRLISELEEDLGIRLFTRSTRNVSLTEEGELLLRRGVALVDELDAVTDEIRDSQHTPRGHLRVSSVVAFGQERVAPAIPAFMEMYPNVRVELEISNRKVDLVQEHYDLAIRIGGSDGLEVSSLKARKIFSQKLVFVATPEYIARHGEPETLDALEQHLVVKQVSGNWGRENDFWYHGEKLSFSLPERFVVNSPNAARNVVLTGGAIGLINDYLVAGMISDGRLVRILPEFQTLDQPVYAVFVHRNYMPAKVRVFIDHLVNVLGAPVQ
ncbi:LysR substrate-binding domain-containing protein [Ruegeria sp. WL0004]|uniref:LysR substrate-binding domain-containing protein n=1 Tax=Ruegeria marisflavi TaxID=2984152 RepID=A0ABT2WKQ8_9RHOB|nr:LysR family transcriptional regulator [Ruegeria sp. WL0004]MCU9836489.1 LysR substrate-binding domain-containing protein [Ruegeria sp. WL0004]